MASEERGQGADLKELLCRSFYRFDFFQAVSLVERLSAGKKGLGEALRPGDEALRFKVRPGFAFPASEISGFKVDEREPCAEMEVAFFGLVGPLGVLPHWYNEFAQERLRNKDATLVEFLNIFHHRLLSLFYLAWKRSRIACNVTPGASDRFSMHFRRLIGISAASWTVPRGLEVEALLHLSGLLTRRIPSVSAMESVVREYTLQAAAVEQFIQRSLQLPVEDRTRLGRANSELGRSVVCGSHCWENVSKFRVAVGPMGLADFRRFLPGEEMLRSVFALVRFMVGIEFEFDVSVILRGDEIPCCRLGGEGGFAARLGWSSWLVAPGAALQKDQRVTFEESYALTSVA